jgi:hypothetical protein
MKTVQKKATKTKTAAAPQEPALGEALSGSGNAGTSGMAESEPTTVVTPPSKTAHPAGQESDNPPAEEPLPAGTKVVAAAKSRAKTTGGKAPGPPKSPGESFISYELAGNKADQNFRTLREAMEFKRDFGDLITKTHKFSSFLCFENHCKRRSNSAGVATPTRKGTAAASGDTDNAAERIAALMLDERPVDTILGCHKTTPTSAIACIFMRFQTQWGSDFWGFKPKEMTMVLNKYSTIQPSSDMTVQEALQNLTYGKARDPDSTNASTPLVVHYTPPGKKDVILIDVYVAYTFITIPHATINTAPEEQAWLSDMTEKFLLEVKTIMSTPVFRSVLERTTHENFFSKLFAAERKSNLPKFLSSSTIRAKACAHYTDHVVQEESNTIVDRMFGSRLGQRKYPDRELDAEFALLSKDIEEDENGDFADVDEDTQTMADQITRAL